jgi:hypothetical protein
MRSWAIFIALVGATLLLRGQGLSWSRTVAALAALVALFLLALVAVGGLLSWLW